MMATFPLKIVCPDGVKFEGQIHQLTVRTTSGEMGILARHINCVAPLGMGEATIVTDEGTRHAACIGGMVSMMDGKATLVPTTFEWADEIDVARAEASEKRAQDVIKNSSSSDSELLLAETQLKRALIRKGVAGSKQM